MCFGVIISFIWSTELFGIRTPRRENRAPELWGREERKATEWKLFHREERPAFERNTIDTSEWTCEDHRYVIGQHFGFEG